MDTRTRMFYIVVNFLIFVSLAAVNTQMIPFMTTVGYTLMQQGIILAGGAVCAIVGQFLFGYLCDRFHRIRRFFLIGYVIFLAAAVAMLLHEETLFTYHLFAIALSAGMVKVLMGLNETWMVEADGEHYGMLRAGGALGLCVGSPLTGFIVTQASYQVLLYALLGLALLVSILLFFCKDVQKQGNGSLKRDLGQLLSDRQYLLLVLILLLIYIAGTADQYTVVDKLLAIGGNAQDVGWKWGIQSFAEVPIFFIGNLLLKKLQARRLLLIGICMYAVKFFLYALFQTPLLLIVCALLQLVTLPLVLLASKELIRSISEASTASSAQMFAMAVFIGGSALITPLLTSVMVGWIGYDPTLYAISAFCLLPLILTRWLHPDRSDGS